VPEQHQRRIGEHAQFQQQRRAPPAAPARKPAAVAVDAIDLAGDVGFSLVQQQRLQPHDRATITPRCGVHRIIAHAMPAPIEQAQVMVVLAPRMLPAPEHALAARQVVAAGPRRREFGAHVAGAIRGQRFIGVQ